MTPRAERSGGLRRRLSALLCAAAVAAFCASPARAEYLLLQSTTSTQVTGLFDALLPAFQAASGIEVRVVAVGTGQALRNAADGNGDVVLVHAQAAEEAFIAAGHGLVRHPVMYNSFVLVGPASDPAGVSGLGSAAAALARIAERRALFVTRGDDSGTHQRELALWQDSGRVPDAARDVWYRDVGSGMERALAIALELDAYTLSDEATWLALPDHGTHRIVLAGDPALYNQYSVILVNPARHPHVNAAAGQRFIDWLTGSAGQAAIAAFAVNGRQLYFPNAQPAGVTRPAQP